MDDLTLARVVHVIAILGWIGGVWFVTFVAMPAIRVHSPGPQRLADFHRLERRFVWQARLWVLLAGISGFWMVHRADMWARFAEAGYWWMHAMVLLWLLFAMMLFVVEPLVLHRRMDNSPEPERDFRRMERLHRILSLFALITLAGAIAGSHGGLF